MSLVSNRSVIQLDDHWPSVLQSILSFKAAASAMVGSGHFLEANSNEA